MPHDPLPRAPADPRCAQKMEGGVSYCDWDSMPEFTKATWPVGRKQHRCCECRFPIAKGEKHLAFTGKWDREVDTLRQHLECEQACVYVRDKIRGGECLCFGEFFDYLADAFGRHGRKTDPDAKHIVSLVARAMWRSRHLRRAEKKAKRLAS